MINATLNIEVKLQAADEVDYARTLLEIVDRINEYAFSSEVVVVVKKG